MTIWGGLGSLLDSFLGGWFQASVIETRRGMVIEGAGGKKVGTFLDVQSLMLTYVRCSCTAFIRRGSI